MSRTGKGRMEETRRGRESARKILERDGQRNARLHSEERVQEG
jgi:hypothetical protein